MEQPFFIVGVHRSGTTLLRYMLVSHSRLYIPPETDFIPYFFGKDPKEELTLERIGQILEVIFSRYRFVDEWKGDQLGAVWLMERMEYHTPAGFLNALYGAYAEQNGAVRWGDKTPIYASYVDLLHQIFPRAKFIHIIRDPFDASISLLEKYEKQEFHIDIYFAAHNWVRRINHAQASGERLGAELYYEIRYEDLVLEPERELKAICAFLGENYEPAMLDHQQLARERIPKDSHFFANVRRPVHTSSIGRGRRDLPVADKRLIQHVAGKLMKELAYSPEVVGKMPLQEKIHFNILRTKYCTLQAGRRVLQSFGLFPPI